MAVARAGFRSAASLLALALALAAATASCQYMCHARLQCFFFSLPAATQLSLAWTLTLGVRVCTCRLSRGEGPTDRSCRDPRPFRPGRILSPDCEVGSLIRDLRCQRGNELGNRGSGGPLPYLSVTVLAGRIVLVVVPHLLRCGSQSSVKPLYCVTQGDGRRIRACHISDPMRIRDKSMCCSLQGARQQGAMYPPTPSLCLRP